MRSFVILNPAAGAASAGLERLERAAARRGGKLRRTRSPAEAARAAREALDAGCQRLVVGGGDGAVHHVVNGLAPEFDQLELAIVPLGTGNDLARSLGLTAERLDEACEAAFGDRLEQLDLVRIIDGRVSYAVNAANGGFGGKVAADVQPADKQRWGPFAYWMTAFSKLVQLTAFQVELTLDQRAVEAEVFGVAAANGRFVGGGFPIAPRAVLNDGLLDVTTIPALPMLELFAAGLNFTLGRDQRDDRVRTYRAQRVRVRSTPDMPFSVDGEPAATIDTTFEVAPRVLSMAVGPAPVGLSRAPSLGAAADGPLEDERDIPGM